MVQHCHWILLFLVSVTAAVMLALYALGPNLPPKTAPSPNDEADGGVIVQLHQQHGEELLLLNTSAPMELNALLLAKVTAAANVIGDGSGPSLETEMPATGTDQKLLPEAGNQSPPIIQPMNAFLERFFAGRDSIDPAEWERALPSELERQQMQKLIRFLLQMDDFSSVASDPGFLSRFVPLLSRSITLTFVEHLFCVIHERFPPTARPRAFFRFPRFWGYTVLSARVRALRPHLHHSSPHFQSDGDVCNETSALFERTLSRSLVVAGANRFAVRRNGANASSSPCQPSNAAADAAHNDRTMFHAVNVALLEADGAPGTFVQWHGMASTSCRGASAFLSVGAKGSHPIYAEQAATVNRMTSSLNAILGSEVAMTPATDAGCRLVAATNIFGRIINGVPAKKACTMSAKPNNVKGHFIHVEQKGPMIGDWTTWVRVLEEVFPAVNGRLSHADQPNENSLKF